MPPPASVRALLLARRGVAFLESSGPGLPDDTLRGLELELAEIGYVLSDRLRNRLRVASIDEVVAFRTWALDVLLEASGGGRKLEPLFRSFPKGVPADTVELWWKKVLVHFLQGVDQPCLFCGRVGTTHVLNPCRHVVCDRCFDGASYSACPSCERHVDRGSPFFWASDERPLPKERVTFKRLELGDTLRSDAQALFAGLCERKQALSPPDRDALTILLKEFKRDALGWLPKTIPLRENIAVVFGTLFQECGAADVLPAAKRHMTTATDVLRFLAVLSGTDGSLVPEVIVKVVEKGGWISKLIGRPAYSVPIKVRRFKVAKLSRALRRTLLAVLDGLPPESLLEDLLRHRSYWVWLGEFLHPGEYAARFPNVARAFDVVRANVPKPLLWAGRVERAKDAATLLPLLEQRPGELARRFDHALRLTGDPAVVEAFRRHAPSMATPVLLTLKALLPTRLKTGAVRVYWPKGRVATGAVERDPRHPLPRQAVEDTVAAIEAELLRRFAAKPGLDVLLLDEDLRNVTVPFNERTSSAAAVDLPRGSRVPAPAGKLARLFLHWCEPEKDGCETDLDLSVAFYDADWRYVSVCSYYELNAGFAKSAGDLRDAPWPEGATEYVDVHRGAARSKGVRYAVPVINAYRGMPFSRLERGFAGLMLRDDEEGAHFDPRTVALRFTLAGENGVFLPFVLDLETDTLHWLDIQAKGALEMNNVESSKGDIAKLCPALMDYFASGARPSMFDLGLLHGAARASRVQLRGGAIYVRRPGESPVAFYARLRTGPPDEARPSPPSLALLFRGDLELPKGCAAYALFRERVAPTLSAADLLS